MQTERLHPESQMASVAVPGIAAVPAASVVPAVPAMPSARLRAAFAPLFLASGACLLVYVFAGISLLASVGVAFSIVLGVVALRWRVMLPAERVAIARRFKVGLLSGLIATGAYDGFRYLIIEVFNISFWPFDIFSIFGQALLGAGATGVGVTAAGVGFHLLNGVGFGTAYTIMFGHRGIWAGIAWAYVLEVMMVSVYPGWLEMKALEEFLQVSALGHTVYGGVLGSLSARLLRSGV